MQNEFFSLIADVTKKELQCVGKEDLLENTDPEYSMYAEQIRRVQVWTLEHLAETVRDQPTFYRMFMELANGVRRVPDIDLWIRESGAGGQ